MKNLAVAVIATCLYATAAGAAVVTPTNTDGWMPSNVRPGGSVAITDTYKPAGQQGSLEFNTVSSASKADYVKYWGVVDGRTLGNLSTLSFDFLRDSSSTTNQHFAPALRLIYEDSDGETGYLIWENIYNGGSTSTPVATDTFQSNDILAENFWMRAISGGGRTIEDFDVTLAQWADGYTSGTSHQLSADTLITGIEVGVGSGWGGTFSGAVDNVAIGFSRVSYRSPVPMAAIDGTDLITADFEPDAIAAVPESSTWAMMIGGFGLIGGTLRRRRAIVSFA